jgi:hypothetical protein
MITLAEVARGVLGAYRLARRDPGGMALFDASPYGYWRSFWAAVVVAPAFLILDLATGGYDEGYGLRQAVVQAIAYVIDWTAFPLVMIALADALGKWPRYRGYIVAYNWSGVLQMALLLPLALIAIAFPSPPTMILAQVAGIIMLVYRAYVAHVALQVGFGVAIGIVVLDVLLSGFLKAVSDSLMGV